MHISYSFRFSTGVELRDITHISLRACMLCMYWYGILEGTRAWCYNYRDGEGDTAPENFGIYSFIEQDQSTFFYVGRSKMLLFWAKHLHTFFVLT